MNSKELVTAFAPEGSLRAAINVGNPMLAARDNADPLAAKGVSVDLASALAAQLDVAAQLTIFETAAECVAALSEQRVDIGFFAIDPARGADVNFTAPYVLIEGAYAVRNDSTLTDNAQVDAKNHRVVVGKGSAYDLFLTRSLKHAEIIRTAKSQTVVSTMMAERFEVAAGVKQQLEADTARNGAMRLLPGSFMVIKQAMGIAKSRPTAAYQHLCEFVEEKKNSGWVAEALARHGIQGASVAPT
jgi:polar amino acid transport system substrate-binding protein